MGWRTVRLPTLKAAGRVMLAVGVVALGAHLVWRAYWPAVATIDAPADGTSLAGCALARGHLMPRTIWRPLWLIGAEAGGPWRPLARIDSSRRTWQQTICAEGRTGTKNRFALVLVDGDVEAAFKPVESDETPDWLKPRVGGEQQGGRGRRRHPDFFPIPPQARPLATLELEAVGAPLVDDLMARSLVDSVSSPAPGAR